MLGHARVRGGEDARRLNQEAPRRLNQLRAVWTRKHEPWNPCAQVEVWYPMTVATQSREQKKIIGAQGPEYLAFGCGPASHMGRAGLSLGCGMDKHVQGKYN